MVQVYKTAQVYGKAKDLQNTSSDHSIKGKAGFDENVNHIKPLNLWKISFMNYIYSVPNYI